MLIIENNHWNNRGQKAQKRVPQWINEAGMFRLDGALTDLSRLETIWVFVCRFQIPRLSNLQEEPPRFYDSLRNKTNIARGACFLYLIIGWQWNELVVCFDYMLEDVRRRKVTSGIIDIDFHVRA